MCVCASPPAPHHPLPHFICIQSMAGCGLSEDTFLSSFFYNYGSSWETPSDQVRGGTVPGGVAPRAPRRALTWHSAGRQRLGRGVGRLGGGKWVALSGSVPTGERRYPSSPALALPSPGSVASLSSPMCHLPHLHPPTPATSQPSGNPRKTLEPEHDPGQLQAKPGNSSATFPKSPRAPRPCAPGARRPPVAPRGCGAASPPRCALPIPPLSPPGAPQATSFPKMAAISSGGVP